MGGTRKGTMSPTPTKTPPPEGRDVLRTHLEVTMFKLFGLGSTQQHFPDPRPPVQVNGTMDHRQSLGILVLWTTKKHDRPTGKSKCVPTSK